MRCNKTLPPEHKPVISLLATIVSLEGDYLKKFRFIVSLITDDNDYQRQQASDAQETATRLGVDLQILFANNDAIYQSQQLLDVVQARDAGVNGILVEPASRTAFPKVAQAAVAAGISWVVLNCEADYLKELRSKSAVPVFAVSADNHEVGRIQGVNLPLFFPKAAQLCTFRGHSLSTVTEQRSSGMLETKPGSISIRVLKSANGTEEAGFHAVASWLRLSTSHQEQIHVVQAQNDFLALGARRAMEEQTTGPAGSNKSRVPSLGVDGLPKTGQAWVRQHFGGYYCCPPDHLARPSTRWLLRFRGNSNKRSGRWSRPNPFLRPMPWQPTQQPDVN